MTPLVPLTAVATPASRMPTLLLDVANLASVRDRPAFSEVNARVAADRSGVHQRTPD